MRGDFIAITMELLPFFGWGGGYGDVDGILTMANIFKLYLFIESKVLFSPRGSSARKVITFLQSS